MATTVLLVDDHDVFRSGLRELLEEEGLVVVAEASSGEDAVGLAAGLQPRVCLLDVRLGEGIDGVETARRLRASAPATRVLMLTASVDAQLLRAALQAGASGFVLKEAYATDVTLAVRAAARGEAYLSPRAARILVASVAGEGQASADGEDAPERRFRPAGAADGAGATDDPSSTQLTERDLAVLRLLAQGRENAQIAEALFLSPATVKNRVAMILEKLGLDNRVQAAVYAVRAGLD